MTSIRLEDVAGKLNAISWEMLELLLKQKDVSYHNLRNQLNVSQEKCSREIARLEGALLIHSDKDPKDGRILLFNITENGKEILKHKN